MGEIEYIICKFKPYIRVFGALGLAWAIFPLIPLSDPSVLGLFLVCYMILFALEALNGFLAGAVGSTVASDAADEGGKREE